MATAAPTRTVTLTTQATVTADGLALTPEVMQKLALPAGSHVSVTVHPDPSAPAQGLAEELVQKLRTMLGDGSSLEDDYSRNKEPDAAPVRSAPIDREAAAWAIQELRASFAGQPSLEDEYFRTRDKDKW